MRTFIFFCLVLLSGCATITRQPPTLNDYSDHGVLAHSKALLAYWGNDATGAEVLGYGGAISVAGLSTGTLLAAAGGSPAAPGLAMGSALISWVLGILKPTGHGHVIAEAASLVMAAESKYFVDKTQAGIATVPTDCMTTFAATLAASINQAKSREMRLRQALAPVDPQVPGQAVGLISEQRQGNNCGR